MENQRLRIFFLREGALWWLLYNLLWWLLSGGTGWGVGVVLALLAAVLSVWLRLPPLTLRWLALPGFLGFFVRALLVGALDVARRALMPGASVAPAWRHYPLQLTGERERLLFSIMVGLLPGTLASRVEGDCLHLHVIDTEQTWQPTVQTLEYHLGRLGESAR